MKALAFKRYGKSPEIGFAGVPRPTLKDDAASNLVRTGSLAEFAVVPERAATSKPTDLNFVQAASIPMVGFTSWQALKERAHLRAGQKVFIPAGSGGIGAFAIQFAKHLGAKVGTTILIGLLDAAFACARRLNFLLRSCSL